MESGSNKSLYTLIAVVVFGIFLSLYYFLFQDNLKGVLADVMDGTSVMTSQKLNNNGLIPTDKAYFSGVENADGSYTITDYDAINGPSDLIIPSEIDGHPVTTIAAKAFYNKGLTSLVLPDSLVTIEGPVYGGADTYKGTFANNHLKQLRIPDSVTSIGTCAFRQNEIEAVYLGSGLQVIGAESFAYNYLKELAIPNSVITIHGYSFAGNQINTLSLGDHVKTIGSFSFVYNKLTSVTIPNSVTSLQTFALGSNPLTSLNLPKSLESSVLSNPNILVKSYTFSDVTKSYTPTTFYSNSIVHYY